MKYEKYGVLPFCVIPPVGDGGVVWKVNVGCCEELRVLCECVRVERGELSKFKV